MHGSKIKRKASHHSSEKFHPSKCHVLVVAGRFLLEPPKQGLRNDDKGKREKKDRNIEKEESADESEVGSHSWTEMTFDDIQVTLPEREKVSHFSDMILDMSPVLVANKTISFAYSTELLKEN